MHTEQISSSVALAELKKRFEDKSGLYGVVTEAKLRPDGDLLIFKVPNPTERLYRVLETVCKDVLNDCGVDVRATIVRSAQSNPLQSPEGRFLLRTISESLNVNRYSFKDDFFSRYTKSVSGAEEQITAAANHIVFGRRGAGKSSLLLYGLHSRAAYELPSIWVDMQVFAQRDDIGVAVDLFLEILKQAGGLIGGDSLIDMVRVQLNSIKEQPSINEAVVR